MFDTAWLPLGHHASAAARDGRPETSPEALVPALGERAARTAEELTRAARAGAGDAAGAV